MQKLSFHYYSTAPSKTVSRKPTTQQVPSHQCMSSNTDVLYQNQCPSTRSVTAKLRASKSPSRTSKDKPEGVSPWYWKLKQAKYGAPPTRSEFRTSRYRWNEEPSEPKVAPTNYINPFKGRTRGTRRMGGPEKRKIIENWGKLWDSALSDFVFERTIFVNHPDEDKRKYRTDNERINDGCRKLCVVAKMNQNIITTMMKKFVSGPPDTLYTLNRVEAAKCWERVINDDGLVNENCCVNLPTKNRRKKFHIPALRTPSALEKDSFKNISSFRIPNPDDDEDEVCTQEEEEERVTGFKKNPTYWLDPKLIPPVPPGFKEHEFYIRPQDDPAGTIKRELQQAKEIAKRYTRFQHIIERSKHYVPNMDKVNRIMDDHFVSKDPFVRRQTMLHNFYSSPKMETSPKFLKDALFATILANDNPKGAIDKIPFPYSLAEMTKGKAESVYGKSFE